MVTGRSNHCSGTLCCYTGFQNQWKNKAIQELAKLLGRSPGSVSYKLSNLLELDKHRKGGPKGFGNYSKTDEEIMKKFSAEGDPGNLKLDLLHDALAGLCDENSSSFYIPQNLRLLRDSLIIEEPRTGNEVLRLIRTRTNQSYFRSSVLANCGEKCAITECNIPSLWKQPTFFRGPLSSKHEWKFQTGSL